MKGRGRWVAGAVGFLALVALVALTALRGGDDGVAVRAEVVEHRDLVATVTASGSVRARRSVDISSDVMGRVVELTVDEGDEVEAGEVLLRLDPAQYRAALARARASLAQARAQVAQQRASVLRAERESERIRGLRGRDSSLVSRQQLDEAETNLEVVRAQLAAARHGVEQAEASLEEAEDQLARTVIRAPMSGTVTRLNIDEGETAVVGTMNNPGSLLLTISDLSVVEALLEVDETDVPRIDVGDSAVVEIDAFPDDWFSGTVSRIGHSAVRPPAAAGGGQAAAVDFEVVVALDDPPLLVRPDLSATADIVTDVRHDVPAIPILSLTVREGARIDSASVPTDRDDSVASPLVSRRSTDEEGVFRIRDGRAAFVPVRVGITGTEHFEVLSGLAPGDTVVAGPYASIRDLRDGTPIRPVEAGADREATP